MRFDEEYKWKRGLYAPPAGPPAGPAWPPEAAAGAAEDSGLAPQGIGGETVDVASPLLLALVVLLLLLTRTGGAAVIIPGAEGTENATDVVAVDTPTEPVRCNLLGGCIFIRRGPPLQARTGAPLVQQDSLLRRTPQRM